MILIAHRHKSWKVWWRPVPWLGAGRGLVAPKAQGGQTYEVTADEDIGVLRIELEDITPLIWRRVAVRTSMNLKAVRSVIQAAMGWLEWPRAEAFQCSSAIGFVVPEPSASASIPL